jgi:hypothetical protein
MADSRGSLIESRRKVLRRLYEPLLLLSALGQVRGERIKKHVEADTTELDKVKARRSIADGIAYICAYDKIPECVTAAALEQSPSGVILWLAANGGIIPKVQEFIEDILGKLNEVPTQNSAFTRNRRAEEIQNVLLTSVIDFNEARLRIYCKQVRSTVKECEPILTEVSRRTGECSVEMEAVWR